jgi:uncharacterized damage-inducible protein DinB
MRADGPPPWLAGPVEGVPDALQPVAHALLQSQLEVHAFTRDFPDDLLWEPVAGLAPVGYHLRHIRGVIDRLFMTAEIGAIGDEQRERLEVERRQSDEGVTVRELVAAIDEQVAQAFDQLRRTEPAALAHVRLVGAKGLPSTVAGLLFHAAEHAQRHCGQLLVTTRVLLDRNP